LAGEERLEEAGSGASVPESRVRVLEPNVGGPAAVIESAPVQIREVVVAAVQSAERGHEGHIPPCTDKLGTQKSEVEPRIVRNYRLAAKLLGHGRRKVSKHGSTRNIRVGDAMNERCTDRPLRVDAR